METANKTLYTENLNEYCRNLRNAYDRKNECKIKLETTSLTPKEFQRFQEIIDYQDKMISYYSTKIAELGHTVEYEYFTKYGVHLSKPKRDK